MRPLRHSLAWRYGIAVLSVALAVGVRLLLDPLLGDAFPFATIFFAILVTAWFGGFGPAVVAVITGAMAVSYFLLSPRGTVIVDGMAGWVGLILFCSTGFGIALLGGLMHAATRRVEAGLQMLRGDELNGSKVGRGQSFATERKIQAGFALALICVGATGIIALTSSIRSAEDALQTQRTQKVISTLRAVLSTSTDVETAERGYLITGDNSFLKPYEDGRLRVHAELKELWKLTADNAAQQHQLGLLEPLVAARTDQVTKIIEQFRQQGFDSARATVANGQGKLLQDHIRAVIAQMEATEQSLLAQRKTATQHASFQAHALISLSCVLALSVVALALFAVQHDFACAHQAEAALLAAKKELETRVHERTAKLAVSEARMAGIVGSAMDAIISVDESQKIVLFNAAAEKLFQCPAAEAVGQPLERFIPQNQRQQHRQHLEDFGKSGLVARMMHPSNAFNGRRADGREFPIEASISQVIVDGENIYTVILRDITERKQAEKASVLLTAIVDSSFDAIIGKDLDGIVTSWNRGAEKMFGYCAPEIIGRSIRVLIPPECQEDEENILSRIRRGESVQHFETMRLKKDGGLIDVSVTVSPIKDGAGTIIGASKVARDISERKMAEAARLASESRYRTLFEYAPDGIVIADQKSFYLDANTSVCRMLGYTRAELIGLHASKLVAPAEIPYIGAAIRALSEKDDFKREWQFRRKDGSFFPAEVIVTMMPDGNLMAMIRDVTERKQAELDRRLSHERMLLAAEATGVGIWEWNVQSNRVRWDALMFRLYGVTPTPDGFVDYRVWSEAVLPEDLREQEAALKETLAGRGHSPREFHIRRRHDGAIRLMEAVETIRTNEHGDIEWVVGTNLDITDRRNSERALREKEQQLHATDRRLAEIVHGMTEACFALDTDWRFTFVNDRSEILLQHRREPMLGKTIWEVFPQLAGTPIETNYRRAMTERVPMVFEFFSPIAERWLDVRLFPTGEGIAAFLLDIHARKLGETALRHTQERLNSTLAAGLIGTWTWDIARDNLVADEFTARTFSLDVAAAAKGLPAAAYLSAVADEDQPAVSEKLAHAIQTHGTYDIEYRVRQADGEFVWLQARGRVADDAAGNAVDFHGAVMDITARKQAEAALRESEERFRTLANSMLQLAWIARPDGFIVWYNQRWYEYTGTTPAQMEGWGWQNVHDPEVLPHVMERWQGAIAAGVPFEMEFPLRGTDGRFRRFLTRGQPFKNAAGKVMQWFGTNTDVETLKQAEEKIQRLNVELEERVLERTAQLEAANKELESFSYSVSHDLRAPLRAVNGFAGIVLEEHAAQLNDEGRRYLERIRNGGRRMGELIDDLLAFSRLSRQPLNCVPVDPAKLVQAVLDELAHEREGRAIDLRLGDLPLCQADPVLLKQVWVNLISNAVKYSRGRSPAVIEIGCELRADGPVYFVRDNGTGFDMRYAHKLFIVFQRLHRADEFEGTGVGLAIVQRIVHRHGGKVWAEAAAGRGATFYFTLKAEKIS